MPVKGEKPMNIRRRLSMAVLAVSAALACGACATSRTAGRPAGQRVKLACRESDALANEVGYLGSAGSPLGYRPRRKPTATPVFFSRRPLYGQIALGDGENREYLFVLDESRGTGSGYDVLYFDCNNNLDLTDDGETAGEIEDPRRTMFPMVKAVVAQGPDRYAHHLKPRFYNYSSPSISFQSVAYRVGTLKIDGEQYPIALFDDKLNARFNDTYEELEGRRRQGTIYGRGDAIVIDFNKDGKFDKDYYGSEELFSLGKYLVVGANCYDVAVEPDGRGLTLQPTAAPCGRVAVDDDGWVDLFSDDGTIKLTGPGKCEIPAGKYRIFRSMVEGQDEGGRIWRAIGRGEWELEPIQVEEGKVTKVEAGAPLVASVSVEKRSRRQYEFDLEIRGAGGEAYAASNIRPTDGSGRPDAPTFKVVNADGETVASGTFEYG
jgi:hypothetical protein